MCIWVFRNAQYDTIRKNTAALNALKEDSDSTVVTVCTYCTGRDSSLYASAVHVSYRRARIALCLRLL